MSDNISERTASDTALLVELNDAVLRYSLSNLDAGPSLLALANSIKSDTEAYLAKRQEQRRTTIAKADGTA